MLRKPRGCWIILGGATPEINVRLYDDIITALESYKDIPSFVILSYSRLIHNTPEAQLDLDAKGILDTLETFENLAHARDHKYNVILSSYAVPYYALLERVETSFLRLSNLTVFSKPKLVVKKLKLVSNKLNVGILCNHFEMRSQIYHDLLAQQDIQFTPLDHKQTDTLMAIYALVHAKDNRMSEAQDLLDVLLWQFKNQGVTALIVDQALEKLVPKVTDFLVVTPSHVVADTIVGK